MAKQNDFDLLPILLIAGGLFLIISYLKPKPAQALEVTGIKYGGLPSPYPPERDVSISIMRERDLPFVYPNIERDY